METHASRFPYLALLIVGIAVILSSTAGIAGIMGWLPAPTGGSGDIPAPGSLPVSSAPQVAVPHQVESENRAKARCAECGVVVSTREIDAHDDDAPSGVVAGNEEPAVTSARRYEITIRMADRSSRVIRDGSPANWRPGEHVIVIDGAKPSNK